MYLSETGATTAKRGIPIDGLLEETNEPYAIAKIAGIKLCEAYRDQYGCNFISAMPTNLYGPNDNYNLQNSHVIPALIRKIIDAKENNHPTVEIWGTGAPLREFLHVDDLADACFFLMHNYEEKPFVNIGVGHDLSITQLAEVIADIIGYEGSFVYNTEKPDGTPRKLMDVSYMKSLGWEAGIDLKTGLGQVIETIKGKDIGSEPTPEEWGPPWGGAGGGRGRRSLPMGCPPCAGA
nr:NAD-dependent epimerase/dehydratase family protein [Candidatus Brachybacter algidus]